MNIFSKPVGKTLVFIGFTTSSACYTLGFHKVGNWIVENVFSLGHDIFSNGFFTTDENDLP